MIREDIEVGDSQAFNFLPPFDGLLSNKTIYTIESVSVLQSLVDKGLNPKVNIYELYNIAADWDMDISNNIHIVELTVGSKNYYVPINKIVSKNNEPQVIYSERMIGIKLGYIPDAEDISILLDDLDLFIKDRLGIVSKIGSDVISARVVIAEADHIAFNNTRNAIRTQLGNYKKLYYDLQVVHQQLITKIQSLETAYLNGAMN